MADSDSVEDELTPSSISVRQDHIRYAISLLELGYEVNKPEGRRELLKRLQSNECIIAKGRCRYVQSTVNKKRSLIACLQWIELLDFDGVISDRMLTYDILKTMLTETPGLCPKDMAVSTSTGRSIGRATRKACCVNPRHYTRGTGIPALRAYMASLAELLSSVTAGISRLDPSVFPRLQAVLDAGQGIFSVPPEIFRLCSLALFTPQERAYKPINRRPGRRAHDDSGHESGDEDADTDIVVQVKVEPVHKPVSESPAPRRRRIAEPPPRAVLAAAPAPAPAAVVATHEELQTVVDPFSIGALPSFSFATLGQSQEHRFASAPVSRRRTSSVISHELHAARIEPLYFAAHPEHGQGSQQVSDNLLDMYDAHFINLDYDLKVLGSCNELVAQPPVQRDAFSLLGLPSAQSTGLQRTASQAAAASLFGWGEEPVVSHALAWD